MCWTEVSNQAEENRWFQALAGKTGRIKFIKKYPKTLKGFTQSSPYPSTAQWRPVFYFYSTRAV